MSCNEVRDLAALYLYGEVSAEQEEAVEQHIHTCGVCAAEMARLRALHAAVDESALEPPETLLLDCRRELRLKLAREAAPAGSRVKLAAAWNWLAAGWRPVGALALLALGFVLGRAGDIPSTEFAGTAPAGVLTRVRAVEPEGNGRVRLVVEETRQRAVSGALSDGRIRGLLLAGVHEGDDGVRVNVMDLLQQEAAEAEVRRAFLTALERDANPGIRLRAIQALKPYAGDPAVQRALAQVLLHDEHDGVRTHAIDTLVQHKPRAVVGALQELVPHESNSYIRLRLVRLLHELNASDGAF